MEGSGTLRCWVRPPVLVVVVLSTGSPGAYSHERLTFRVLLGWWMVFLGSGCNQKIVWGVGGGNPVLMA